MASAMRFTTTELAELETKIANAADRALAIELGVFDRLVGRGRRAAEAIRAGAAGARRARRVGRARDARRRPRTIAGRLVDDSLAFAIEGGRHPVVEQALRAPGRQRLRRQ